MTRLADGLLIACAGRGARLTGRPAGIPKPLVTVGGRSLLEQLIGELDLLVAPGGARIFVTAPGDERIPRLARRVCRGAAIVTQERPDGVAGALLAARAHLRGRTLVALGDLWLRGEISAPYPEGPAVVVWDGAPVEATAANFGVRVEAGRVVAVREKPRDPGNWLCGIGLYVMTPAALGAFACMAPDPRTGERGITEALATAIGAGVAFGVARFAGDYRNVNTPADLRAARALAHERAPA